MNNAFKKKLMSLYVFKYITKRGITIKRAIKIQPIGLKHRMLN